MKPQFAAAAPLVAVLLFVVAYFAPDHAASSPDRPLVSVKVARTTYACPLLAGGEAMAGQVTAGSAAAATALTAGQGKGTAEQAFANPSQWRSAKVPASALVVTQQGKGSGAVGFSVGSGSSRQGGGAAYTRCAESVSVGWFLGLAAVDQHNSRLQLTNLGSEPAVVDIDLFDSDGPVDAVDAKGVVVNADSTTIVPLSKLAAGESDVAVRVTGDRGAVAVQALDVGTGTLRGTEWQEPAEAGRTLVLSGISAGGDHVLKIVNPGNSTANVAVRAISSGGDFAVEGLSDISVSPGTEQSVKLPSTVSLAGTALELTSDVQIAAATRSDNGTDFSFGQAADELDGPTVVPVANLGPSVLLTAPGKAAQVRVEVFNDQMASLGSSIITVKAGTSQVLDPASVAKGGSYAVITPQGGGEIYGSASFATGKQITSFPLGAAPVMATAPSVTMP